MANPDKKQLESMARICFNEKPFMDYLLSMAEKSKDDLVKQTDGEQLRVLQGRAQAYTELHKIVSTAHEIRKA